MMMMVLVVPLTVVVKTCSNLEHLMTRICPQLRRPVSQPLPHHRITLHTNVGFQICRTSNIGITPHTIAGFGHLHSRFAQQLLKLLLF